MDDLYSNKIFSRKLAMMLDKTTENWKMYFMTVLFVI